ncbi:MAG: glucose/arabinose dehydrogenase, partial [Paraglaciecola sp.]
MSRFLQQFGVAIAVLFSGASYAQKPEIAVAKSNQSYKYELLVEGIDIPWGMTWLDKKTILVSDRKGELRVISNGLLLNEKVTGLPELRAQGQGG